jgi:hypothetical protein
MASDNCKTHPSRRKILALAVAGIAPPSATDALAASSTGVAPCGDVVVSVAGLRKNGPRYDEVALYLNLLSRDWICGSALSFFGGAQRVQDYVNDLLRYGLLAVGNVTDRADPSRTIHAFVSTCGSDVPPGVAALVVNVHGDFFRDDRDPDPRVMNLGGRRAVLLLHEMAHALEAPGILPDRENPASGAHNTALVMEHCAETIAAAAHWFRRARSRRTGAARVVELPSPLRRAA